MRAVREWRVAGLPVAYTIDAGPNVHVICPQAQTGLVAKKLRDLPGVIETLVAKVGGPAKLV